MIPAVPYAGAVLGRPLDPSPDRARSLLRRELVKPEYDQNLLQRFLDWLERTLQSGLDRASSASPLSTLMTLVVFLCLLLAAGWLLSRVRRSSRVRPPSRAVLGDERRTAAELRALAEAALAAGRPEEALVEGFRALTTRQIERRRLDDLPGATAHEVAERLGSVFPGHQPRVAESADLFDLVVYGDRPATAQQASGVLSLDDELARAR